VTDDHLWGASLEFLSSLHHLRGALANAALLASVRSDWEDQVVARTSMHDLLFTLPDEEFPWDASLRVSAVEGGFEFTLHKPHGHLAAQEHCEAAMGESVLRSHLERLVTAG
jgi:hypothetical protein